MSLLGRLFGGGPRPQKDTWRPPGIPTPQDIEDAQRALTFTLPPSYQQFLTSAGPLQVGLCAEFYWLGPKELGSSHIVEANRREREESEPALPSFLIAFYTDGMGNQICFDTRRSGANGEYPVVFWDHELDAEENLRMSEAKAGNLESSGTLAGAFDEWYRLMFKEQPTTA